MWIDWQGIVGPHFSQISAPFFMLHAHSTHLDPPLATHPSTFTHLPFFFTLRAIIKPDEPGKGKAAGADSNKMTDHQPNPLSGGAPLGGAVQA